ncbi:MAG: succinate dehydrogenase, cytochrome b556 subunit [Rhodospirillaceae bacterium]|nr:succinate dehydrogenase, cytochrome b556 subunit [Rhodospirillaceae bacterium]
MTQTAKPADRPLSPHVFIYRWPLASLLSITHRITGIGLTIGTLLLTSWIVSATHGGDSYAAFTAFIGSPFGYFLLLGFSLALFYHLCNGIRHLFWDAGMNFEIAQTNSGNWLVLSGTVVLTAAAWLLALM